MTGLALVGGVLIGIAVGFVGYAWITRPERVRTAQRLARETERSSALLWAACDMKRKYRESVAREAVWLRLFGGDTPEAVAALVEVEARS